MIAPTSLASYTSVYATPELVGRDALIEEIQSLTRATSDEPLVIFLHGPGGVGKTRILLRLLELTQQDAKAITADTLIDLYHINTHSPTGLAEEIYHTLTPPFDPFRPYERERQVFDRLRVAGDVGGIDDQRQRMLEAFNRSLVELSEQQRVVLALDTAERLVYGIEHFATLNREIAEVWQWLLDSLQQWKNVCLLVAGRPESAPLIEKLRAQPGVRLVERNVTPLDARATAAYFDAVARAAEANHATNIATLVRSVPAEARERAYRGADGRPILLATIVDLLTVPSALGVPQVLNPLFAPPDRTDPLDANRLVNDLENRIISRLISVDQIGETILALGRAPKGVDRELLARLLDISENAAQQRLEQVRNLSFVKLRPADKRYFLHDEIYAMLRRQVYDQPDDAKAADIAYTRIFGYYADALQQCLAELDDLYAPVEVEGRERLDINRIGEVHNRRLTLLTEEIYYRLRQDPVRGYKRYYRYSREANVTSDTVLDLQLQSELLAFWVERDPQNQLDHIDGLARAEVVGHHIIRPIGRAFSSGRNERVLELAAALRAASQPPLRESTNAILSIWESYARIYLATAEHLAAAKRTLDTTIQQMQQLVQTLEGERPDIDAGLWRARAVLALAYRVRGYWLWQSGELETSILDYQQAAKIWRRINFKVELALTLNDLGFVMGELGYTHDARALVNEALSLRRELGLRVQMALSLNTLGLIDTAEGDYLSAIEHCGQALALFRALDTPRRLALALLALSEASRRHSMTPLVPKPEDKVQLLRAARDYAVEAHDIVREKEKIRLIQSYIEQGCALRDWVRVRAEHPSAREDIKRLIAESINAFEAAAKLAGTGAFLNRHVDALVNMTWLGYYANQQDLFAESARRVEASVPLHYQLARPESRQEAEPDKSLPQLWAQMGKFYTVYGHELLRRYLADRPANLATLKVIARYYTVAVHCHKQYGYDHRDLRRTREGIYLNVKDLSADALTAFTSGVQATETELSLAESDLRIFLMRRACW